MMFGTQERFITGTSSPKIEKQKAPIRPMKGEIVGTATANKTAAVTSTVLKSNKVTMLIGYFEFSSFNLIKNSQIKGLHLICKHARAHFRHTFFTFINFVKLTNHRHTYLIT